MFIRQLPGNFDLLSLHREFPERYPFLLEQTASAAFSRYSILFAFPGQSLRVEMSSARRFTDEFDDWFRQEQRASDQPAYNLPFDGGWFVYLGYELAAEVEPVLQLPPDSFQLPVAIATQTPAAVIRDHKDGIFWFVSEDDADNERLQQVLGDVSYAVSLQAPEPVDIILREDDPERYLHGVARIAEYIKAGDVFQVNLSRAWHGMVAPYVSSAMLYAMLRQTNPAPFSALARFDGFSIISSSPERLVSVNNGRIETRPIAGTRPRGDDAEKERAMLAELIAHPKERAEHIMLIDLERNDLGRICKPGTVEVNELMTLETYEHVHHIVSNVRGELADGVTPGEVIRAVFPGGTITGCPKVRCMEIIAELEQTGRGPYTGSLGYITRPGKMDLNILIRTLVKKGNAVNFRTGAGIVYDSIPHNELQETRHKARGLLRAFKIS